MKYPRYITEDVLPILDCSCPVTNSDSSILTGFNRKKMRRRQCWKKNGDTGVEVSVNSVNQHTRSVVTRTGGGVTSTSSLARWCGAVVVLVVLCGGAWSAAPTTGESSVVEWQLHSTVSALYV